MSGEMRIDGLRDQNAELLAMLDRLQEAARNRRIDADALDDAASEARALMNRHAILNAAQS